MPAEEGEEMEEGEEREVAAAARTSGQQVDSDKHWFSVFRFLQPLMRTCGLSLPRQTC